MPPQLIVRRQSRIRKAEQFTPELKWQRRVLRSILRLISQANLPGGAPRIAEYAN